jgi:hypothetical protein
MASPFVYDTPSLIIRHSQHTVAIPLAWPGYFFGSHHHGVHTRAYITRTLQHHRGLLRLDSCRGIAGSDAYGGVTAWTSLHESLQRYQEFAFPRYYLRLFFSILNSQFTEYIHHFPHAENTVEWHLLHMIALDSRCKTSQPRRVFGVRPAG